jgi:hypothetical protein
MSRTAWSVGDFLQLCVLSRPLPLPVERKHPGRGDDQNAAFREPRGNQNGPTARECLTIDRPGFRFSSLRRAIAVLERPARREGRKSDRDPKLSVKDDQPTTVMRNCSSNRPLSGFKFR